VVLVWVKFLICVLLVLLFGTRLSRYGDVIAEKTGLSGIWVGLLLLAIVTSLPEIITGISAVAVVNAPDLGVGTLFGSNAFNLSVIAVLDIVHRPGSLLASASQNHRLSAGLGILLAAAAAGAMLLSTRVWDGAFSWLGIYSVVLVVLYLLGSRSIYQRERATAASPTEVLRYEKMSSWRAYLGFGISAIGIIGTGVWLATVGNEIVAVTGLGSTFVGSLFLALTTSLPEVVVALAALRIGAVDMAIADVLGSNIFNIGFGIPFFDIFSGGASIFATASPDHFITAGVIAVMSLIVIIGLVLRTRRKAPVVMSWYAPVLLAVYAAGAYFLFRAGAT